MSILFLCEPWLAQMPWEYLLCLHDCISQSPTRWDRNHWCQWEAVPANAQGCQLTLPQGSQVHLSASGIWWLAHFPIKCSEPGAACPQLLDIRNSNLTLWGKLVYNITHDFWPTLTYSNVYILEITVFNREIIKEKLEKIMIVIDWWTQKES